MTQPDPSPRTDCGNEWAGCIDGRWYDPCSSEYCTGLCEYTGNCPCTGCEREHCHAKGGDADE